MYETILWDVKDGVGTITLNRPEKLNAFTVQMHKELQDVLKAAERDEGVRCLVLTGAGRAFCAGQDLGESGRSAGMSFRETLQQRYNRLVGMLRNMEKPVIAAVNGVAAGAGANVAFACDLRIASDKASFLQAFVRIGLIPDSGGTWSLPRLAGLGKALELAMLGDQVSAAEAERVGLINRVVPHEQFADAVSEWGARLAKGPTRALGLMKRAMNRGLTMTLEEALDYEAHCQELASKTEDAREGVQAFLEKRQPQYKGR